MITSKFLRNLEVKLSDSEKLRAVQSNIDKEHGIKAKHIETKHVEDKHRS